MILPYEYKDFKNYPTFPQLAPRIYALLEDEETLVAGHATMNDVKYLNLESKRFSLRSFRFRFADTQFVYMNRIGVFNRQFGLGSIAEGPGRGIYAAPGGGRRLCHHAVAEAMCREEALSFSALLEKYGIEPGRIENYEVTQNSSTAQRAYLKAAQAKKEAREAARIEFHNFADREKRRPPKRGAIEKQNGVLFPSFGGTDGTFQAAFVGAVRRGRLLRLPRGGVRSLRSLRRGGRTENKIRFCARRKARHCGGVFFLFEKRTHPELKRSLIFAAKFKEVEEGDSCA